MKLLSRVGDQFIFLIGKRQRQTLLELLRLYPMLRPGHFKRRTNKKSKDQPDEHLLEEALAETRRENKKHLQELLSEENRFVETELGFKFFVKRSELEWLLQIINDIRVGAWVLLGQPDLSKPQPIEWAEEHDGLLAAMHMAGVWETAFLHSISPPPPE